MKEKTDFWAIIEEMGWGRKTTDSTALSEEWFEKLGKEEMDKVSNFVDARVGELQRAVHKYESEHGDLEVGSDDGFSDVTHHIVGMGKEEFDRCVANPKLVEKRYNAKYGTPEGYRESFAYVFLEPEPKRTEADKKAEFVNLIRRTEEVEKEIERLTEVLNGMRSKMFSLSNTLSRVKKDQGL